MIKQIIQYLNTQISELNIFEKTFEICVMVPQKEGVTPYQYNKKGQLIEVSNFDWSNGIVYHRETSPMTQTINPNYDNRQYLKRVYNLTSVFIFNKNITNNDNTYIVDDLRDLICDIYTPSYTNELTNLLSAQSTLINLNSSSIDLIDISNREFSGLVKNLSFEYGIVSVDYDIEILINKNCLLNSNTVCCE